MIKFRYNYKEFKMHRIWYQTQNEVIIILIYSEDNVFKCSKAFNKRL